MDVGIAGERATAGAATRVKGEQTLEQKVEELRRDLDAPQDRVTSHEAKTEREFREIRAEINSTRAALEEAIMEQIAKSESKFGEWRLGGLRYRALRLLHTSACEPSLILIARPGSDGTRPRVRLHVSGPTDARRAQLPDFSAKGGIWPSA
jgi:hypothetical protein